MNELQIAVRRGDARELAGLFAEAFQFDTEPFKRLMLPREHRRAQANDWVWITLEDMLWRADTKGRIKGRGRVVVTAGNRSGAQSLERKGAVELELITVGSDYRIHRLQIQED